MKLHESEPSKSDATSTVECADIMEVLAPAHDRDINKTGHEVATAGIAHDLANLLQVIASAMRAIERTLNRHERQKIQSYTLGTLQCVDRGAVLSRRMIGLAAPMSIQRFAVGDLLHSMRGLIALAAGPDVDVTIICDRATPAIACDARDFENAILNLVVNARDALPDGGRIWVSSRGERDVRRDQPGVPSTTVICVRDNGCGIPLAQLNRVFEPYFTSKLEGRGSGLGLTMVNDFARRAGGVAEVSSIVGEGSSFFLRLPGYVS